MRCSATPPEGRASLQPQKRRLDPSRLAPLTMCVRCAPSPAHTDADGPRSDGPGRAITVLAAADCRSRVTDRTRHETWRKGRAKRDPLSSILLRLLRRIRNPHDRQAFRFRLLSEVQRDPVAAITCPTRRGLFSSQASGSGSSRYAPASAGQLPEQRHRRGPDHRGGPRPSLRSERPPARGPWQT